MRRTIERANQTYAMYGNDLDLICEELGLLVIPAQLEGRLREIYFGDSIVIRKDASEEEKRERQKDQKCTTLTSLPCFSTLV